MVADSTATATATRGTSYYQYRVDNETAWNFTNYRTQLEPGSHVFYVRDVLFPACVQSASFTSGTVSSDWLPPTIVAITTTSNSATLTVKNPNAGGTVRIDYSLTNADVNDASGNFWKWGAEQAGSSPANQNQTLTIPGLQAGKTYYFRGFYYGAGKGNSPWKYLGAQGTASSGEQLGTPVLAFSLNGRDVNLTWTDNSTGQSGYRVQRSYNGTDWETIIGYLGPNDRAYTDPAQPANSSPRYRVNAFSTFDGPFSNVVTATIASDKLAAPVLAVTQSGNNANLTWTHSGGARYFRIEQSTDGGAFSQIVQLDANTGMNFYSVNIADNVTYRFRMYAVAILAQNNSAYSNIVQAYKPGTGSGTGNSGNNSTSVDLLAWVPTQEQVDANNYPAPFTQKQWSPSESPFWSPLLNPPLGKEVGRPSRYNFGFGTMQAFGNSEADLFAAVPRESRFNEVPQAGTLGPMGGTELITDNFINLGQTFNTAFGTITITDEDKKYDYFKVNLSSVPGANPNYGVVRWDIEEHRDYAWSDQWIKGRYCWQGGKFLPASAGGTDPYWSTKSDQFWYDALLDKITQVMIKLCQNTKSAGALVTGYAQFANPNNVIWNRQVSIDGVPQPKLSALVDITNVNDMIVGYYAVKAMFAGANDNGKWFPLSLANKPFTNTVVSARPSRFRVVQTNDLNSARPTLRITYEDENGNVAKSPDGIAMRMGISYATTTQPWADQSIILRSENDQVPDQTVTLNQDVDLSFWKRAVNAQYTFDRGIAEVLVRSHNDRSTAGKMVIQQQYIQANWNCCERYGLCGNGQPGMGQCEVNYSIPLTSNFTTATALFRGVEKIKTAWWADGVDVQNGTEGANATYKGAATYRSIAAMYKALDTYGKYKSHWAGNAYSIPFEISFDGGTTWKTHAQYLASLTWNSTTGEPSVDNKTAAIKIIYNADSRRVTMIGTPLYTDQINPLVRFTIEGFSQDVKTLPLKKSYEDGFYVEWFTK